MVLVFGISFVDVLVIKKPLNPRVKLNNDINEFKRPHFRKHVRETWGKTGKRLIGSVAFRFDRSSSLQKITYQLANGINECMLASDGQLLDLQGVKRV